MKKIKLGQPVYRVKGVVHEFVKPVLCDFFSKLKSPPSKTDCISSLDWEEGSDMEREWVKFFLPFWYQSIDPVINYLNCESINLQDIWFQQYESGGSHGWHIHRGHFTGVYYVELSRDSARTELLDPFTNRINSIKVDEGDLIIFPSHVRHRAPINKSKNKKTIVSWNFEIK
tara:strand:- start:562 stop:1077 length:516 start_codon:yes stop_codon:yes gene_type:complete